MGIIGQLRITRKGRGGWNIAAIMPDGETLSAAQLTLGELVETLAEIQHSRGDSLPRYLRRKGEILASSKRNRERQCKLSSQPRSN